MKMYKHFKLGIKSKRFPIDKIHSFEKDFKFSLIESKTDI